MKYSGKPTNHQFSSGDIPDENSLPYDEGEYQDEDNLRSYNDFSEDAMLSPYYPYIMRRQSVVTNHGGSNKMPSNSKKTDKNGR